MFFHHFHSGANKREYGRAKKWLFPYIGSVPIKDISQFHLERIKKTALDSGQAPRSVQYILAIFRQCWNHARRAGVVQVDSPSRAVKIPKFDNQRLRFLTQDETTRLLAALQIECEATYQQALISLDGGLRAGEILKLTWGDIDTVRETILCRDTKSGRNRTVYMSGRLVDMFNDMKRGQPDALVFPGPGGAPWRSVSKIFKRVVRDLKLNEGIEDPRLRVCFHSLRHTHASRLIEGGVDVYLVKTLLGHRHVTTTERYAHVRAESLRDAIRRMERANQTGNVIPMRGRDESKAS